MLEGLKKFFTGKDEAKSENQRNAEMESILRSIAMTM